MESSTKIKYVLVVYNNHIIIMCLQETSKRKQFWFWRRPCTSKTCGKKNSWRRRTRASASRLRTTSISKCYTKPVTSNTTKMITSSSQPSKYRTKYDYYANINIIENVRALSLFSQLLNNHYRGVFFPLGFRS